MVTFGVFLNLITKQLKDGVQNFFLLLFWGTSMLFTNFVGVDKSADMRKGNVFHSLCVCVSVHGGGGRGGWAVSPQGDPTP